MSRNTLLVVFGFGVIVGASGSLIYLRNRYESIVMKEVNSVRDVLKKKDSVTEHDQDTEKDANDAKTVVDYVNVIKKNNYNNDTENIKPSKAEPYVISPQLFGELEEYDQVSLTYYSDNILADDLENIIYNAAGYVGLESLKSFGVYEDDCVFVQNDFLKCYYEILLDARKYTDVCTNGGD